MPHEVDEDAECEFDRDEARAHCRTEFDCPECDANNPTETFGDGAELTCNYCGSEILAKFEGNKLMLRVK